MLTWHNVQPGELRMFIGYAGKDDFNLDAQAEKLPLSGPASAAYPSKWSKCPTASIASPSAWRWPRR